MWRWIQKMHLRKNWTTTSVGFEPLTSVARLQRITQGNSVSPDWNLSLDTFFSFVKLKPLSYSVYIDLSGLLERSTVTDWSPRKHATHLRVSVKNPSSHENQANFDLDLKTKSWLTPRHKTTSIPTPKLYSSHVPPPTVKSSLYRPPRHKPRQFDAHTKTKRFAGHIQNRVNSDLDHPNEN